MPRTTVKITRKNTSKKKYKKKDKFLKDIETDHDSGELSFSFDELKKIMGCLELGEVLSLYSAMQLGYIEGDKKFELALSGGIFQVDFYTIE